MGKSAYSPFGKLKALIRWMRHARSIDKLDSPLLYEFHREVVQRKLDDPRIAEIEQARKNLLNDDTVIKLKDYGAGSYSSGTASKRKSVKAITTSAVSSRRKCRLLYNACQHLQPARVLELGTSVGISTMYLQAGCPSSKVTTVEGDPSLLQIFQENAPKWAKSIDAINAPFTTAIANLSKQNLNFDLIYIDGGHRSDMLAEHLQALKGVMGSSAVLIIDDIYWSADMTNAWKALKDSSNYNVEIDMWYFGLLWYDERVKERLDIKMTPIDRRWQIGMFR